jgi:outer membrane receptor protein involved in Fe transport
MLGTTGFIPVQALAGDPLSKIQALFPVDKNGFINYPMTGMSPDHKSHTWTELSPMVSLKYTLPDNWLSGSPIDNSMVYFTYSEGFKAGSYDVLGNSLSQLDPETIKNFEIGVKIDAFDRTVRLNLAAYKMKYDDQQLIQVIPNPSTGATTVAYTNAGKSEINGIEAEFVWQPIEGLLINAGASYNDFDYKEFKAGELSTVHVFTQQAAPQVDRSSEPFAEVPTVTYNLAVQYTFDTRFGSIIPRVQANYLSERYMGLDAGAALVKDQSTLPAYTRVDARLTYRSPDERTEIALYVDNLTDKLYYDGAASVGDSVGIFPRVDAPPRMYGVEASYKFGAL